MEAKKLKILFVITKSNWGGAQRYVYDLATSLPASNFDIAVALGGTGSREAKAGKLHEKLGEKNIRTIFVKSFMRDISFFKEFEVLFELIKIFRRERPDVVHLNSSKAGGTGALAARIAGIKKIIFTSHGLAYDESRNILARGIIFVLTWITFLLCHNVIVISKDNQRRAGCLPFCKHKISLIYNGILPIEFFSRDEARAKIAALLGKILNLNAPWVGAISELTRNKGVSYLIEAAKIVKESGLEFSAFVAGDGEDRGALEQKISNLGLQNEFDLLGFLPDAARYLKAFDIFVLPSIKEGLPYVLMEAGAAHLPTIASRISGATDIIIDHESGLLFKAGNSEELAQKLISILNDTNLGKDLGTNLAQRASELFSASQMANSTSALYR